ncbi:permease [Haliovirga abyssi]|uniref:Permease n=1 Tax=Haliovirga abyssi TaxID=2996794 RepID=A0AAU9DHW8_9FUSO|nr:permease [Haliovirga abyssi]BDU50354.1 hypothetical protein HLVA_09230 [Haliovirga abyssi]
MKKSKNNKIKKIIFALFFIFISFSYFIKFTPGVLVGKNFIDFALQMIEMLPPIFILVGLFDVWVKKETIEKHLGKDGGFKSYILVFILAAPMAGGLLAAFPIAYAIYKKGARLTVMLVFLGAVGIGRVPMVLFEASFLGIKFSAIRLIVSIPLVIITGVMLGRALEKREYKLPENNQN